jgi:4-hydroxybenzoate polyprenyltransferase
MFGFEEAFQDYTTRIESLQLRFSKPHTFFAFLIGVFVTTWMVTVYLASLGGIWWSIVTVIFGLLLLAEIEHAVRAARKRGYYGGTVTGVLMVLLGLVLIIQPLKRLL